METLVTITLLVKGDAGQAMAGLNQSGVLDKLNQWLTADTETGPPFQPGSLLHYATKGTES